MTKNTPPTEYSNNKNLLPVNVILALSQDTQFNISDQKLYGAIKRNSDNIISVSGVLDYTKDWNLLVPLVLKSGFCFYTLEDSFTDDNDEIHYFTKVVIKEIGSEYPDVFAISKDHPLLPHIKDENRTSIKINKINYDVSNFTVQEVIATFLAAYFSVVNKKAIDQLFS